MSFVGPRPTLATKSFEDIEIQRRKTQAMGRTDQRLPESPGRNGRIDLVCPA